MTLLVRSQVTGISDERVDRIFGIDAFQAIELALRFISVWLMLLTRDAGGRLRWECVETGGFAFLASHSEEE